MDDKHATTGILVTTSRVTKDGHDFAERHGRIRLIECEEIKYLCREHLGLDVLISLPSPRLSAADPSAQTPVTSSTSCCCRGRPFMGLLACQVMSRMMTTLAPSFIK